MNDFLKPQFKTFEDWAYDNNVSDKVIRYWVREDLKEDPDLTCNWGYLRHFIVMPDNSVMVGIASYDESKPGNVFPGLDFYKLDELLIEWFESDIEE